MTAKSNPRTDALFQLIRDQQTNLLSPMEIDCWRFQTISHPGSRQILNGEGAFRHGGRWNAPGSFHIVYGSTEGHVALHESEANDRYFGLITRKARIYVCISLKLSRVLDLTEEDVLKRLDLVPSHLKAEDWRKIQAAGHESLTQAVGRAAFAAGAEAIIAPSSAVLNGINIAYFPKNKRPGSTVILHDAEVIDSMLRKKRK